MANDRVSRRVLLATASAAGLLASCRQPPRGPPLLRFVGQDPERGHLLRSGILLDAPVHERRRVDVVIVGGGVAGAAAAWRLARGGVRSVELVELEEVVGGTARGSALPRSPHPLAAHYLPAPHPDCRALELLLEELGVLRGRDREGRAEYDTTAILPSPLERHHFRGRWFEGLYPEHEQSPDEESQAQRWREHLRELDRRRGRDGRRLFALPVTTSSTELRELDRITMAEYLDRMGLTSWRLRWLIDYACRDDYGCRIGETSAFAALHHFLSRGLEDEREHFLLAWPQGNAHLVESMLDRADLGDRLHTLAAAYRVEPETGEVRVHRFADDRNVALTAKVILWAAPRFVLPHLLPGPGPAPLGLDYTPWLVANLQLDAHPGGVGAPLSWDNVPVLEGDPDAGPTNLGYVVATHAEAADRRRPGCVITYYEPASAVAVPREQRAHLLSAQLPALAEHVLTELERMHPAIRDKVERIDVSRWGHAMIRPVPGLLFGLALARASAPIGRVLPCAADVKGLPVFEEAFYAGMRAAESALSRLGREQPALP